MWLFDGGFVQFEHGRDTGLGAHGLVCIYGPNHTVYRNPRPTCEEQAIKGELQRNHRGQCRASRLREREVHDQDFSFVDYGLQSEALRINAARNSRRGVGGASGSKPGR